MVDGQGRRNKRRVEGGGSMCGGRGKVTVEMRAWKLG